MSVEILDQRAKVVEDLQRLRLLQIELKEQARQAKIALLKQEAKMRSELTLMLWDLQNMGMRQWEIAAELNTSRNAVCRYSTEEGYPLGEKLITTYQQVLHLLTRKLCAGALKEKLKEISRAETDE